MKDPAVIALLEEVLERAKAGRITSIAIAVAGPDLHIDAAEAAYSGDARELAAIRAQLGGLAFNLDSIAHEMTGMRKVKAATARLADKP